MLSRFISKFRGAKAVSLIFVAIITLFGVLNLLNTDKPTISQLENRELQKMPSFSFDALFKGSYTRDFDNYYSDTFLLREELVLAAHDLRAGLSLAGEDETLMAYEEGAESAQNEEAMQEDAVLVADAEGSSGANTAAGSTENSGSVAADTTAASDQPTASDETTAAASEKSSAAAALTATAAGTGAGNSGSSQEDTQAVSSNTAGTAVSKKPVDAKNLGFWLSADGNMKKVFGFGKGKLDEYARVLNRYGEKMGDGVTVYSLIPPTTGQYLAMKKYAGRTESRNDMADYLNSIFNKNVKAVDVFSSINRHKDEYVYFRSDHHWTMRGAYYGYTALMDFKGITPVPLEKYQVKKVENSLGSIYRNTLSSSLKKNPDTVELFLPFVQHEFSVYTGKKAKRADVLDMSYATWQDKYPIFLSTGGGSYSVIKTGTKNGKKAMIIKTSFGNPFSPLLMSDYEEIYTVDARFYTKGAVGKNIVQFAKDNGIQDVIFVIYDGDVYGNLIMPAAEKLLD